MKMENYFRRKFGIGLKFLIIICILLSFFIETYSSIEWSEPIVLDKGNEKFKDFNENKTFIKPKNKNSIFLGLSIGFPVIPEINKFQGTFTNYLKDENAYGFNLKIFTNKVLGNNYLNLQYFQGETNRIYNFKDNFGVTAVGLYCMFEFCNFNICYDFFLFKYKNFYTSFNVGYSFLFFKLHFIDYWVFNEISRNYQIKPFCGLNFNYKLNERFLFQLSLNIIKFDNIEGFSEEVDKCKLEIPTRSGNKYYIPKNKIYYFHVTLYFQI